MNLPEDDILLGNGVVLWRGTKIITPRRWRVWPYVGAFHAQHNYLKDMVSCSDRPRFTIRQDDFRPDSVRYRDFHPEGRVTFPTDMKCSVRGGYSSFRPG